MLVSDDDNYVSDDDYSDGFYDDDDNRKKQRPHMEVLPCYDETTKYETRFEGIGGSKYADECAAVTVPILSFMSSKYQPMPKIPFGCKLTLDIGVCMHKSMCRTYCTQMLYEFAGKPLPGDGGDSNILDDDYGGTDVSPMIWGTPIYTGCGNCDMVHFPSSKKKRMSAGVAVGVAIAVLAVVG
jgi:hypothetical protein